MAKVGFTIYLPTRAAIWLHYISDSRRQRTYTYIETVLLRHLEQLPEVDLSRSPYSQPKGVSNGEESGKDRGEQGSHYSG